MDILEQVLYYLKKKKLCLITAGDDLLLGGTAGSRSLSLLFGEG